MRKLFDLYGFKVIQGQDKKSVKILNFPHFPQETKQSRKFHYELEKYNFTTRNIQFPIKLDITERKFEVDYGSIDFFTLQELFNIIEIDKDRFINTVTFFKVKLVYENKKSIISIIYYNINSNGNLTIQDINELLDFTFIHYDKKRFTKKFINPRIKKYGEFPNDVEQIPLLPLLWLDYDENNNLKYFNHFQLIDDDRNLPF